MFACTRASASSDWPLLLQHSNRHGCAGVRFGKHKELHLLRRRERQRCLALPDLRSADHTTPCTRRTVSCRGQPPRRRRCRASRRTSSLPSSTPPSMSYWSASQSRSRQREGIIPALARLRDVASTEAGAVQIGGGLRCSQTRRQANSASTGLPPGVARLGNEVLEGEAGNENCAFAERDSSQSCRTFSETPPGHWFPGDRHRGRLSVGDLQRPSTLPANRLALQSWAVRNRDRSRGPRDLERCRLRAAVLIGHADAHPQPVAVRPVGTIADVDPLRLTREPVRHSSERIAMVILESEENPGPPSAPIATPTQFGSGAKAARGHNFDGNPCATSPDRSRARSAVMRRVLLGVD